MTLYDLIAIADEAKALREGNERLAAQVDHLLAAVRKHRDQRGDDRCWMDDEDLYRALPEGYFPPVRDCGVELEMCRHFIYCRQHPGTEYVSPQRRIAELEAEAEDLRKKLKLAYDRIGAQSELLSRKAEGEVVRPLPADLPGALHCECGRAECPHCTIGGGR